MKKPFAVLTTAALFSAAIFTPTAVQAAPASNTVEKPVTVIAQNDQGVNYEVSLGSYNEAFDNKVAPTVSFVKIGENYFSISDYNNAFDNKESIKEEGKALTEEEVKNLKLVEGTIDEDGNLQGDITETPVTEVKTVKAINGTVTVTLAEAVEAVTAADFTVTQTINEDEATAVEVTEAVLAEDGVTVTLTVATVEATDADQSVVYTVNEVAAEAFVVEAVEVEAPEVTTAKEAVAAYEAATISTYADVAGVEALEAEAQEAIDAVEDAEVKAELQTALDEAKAVNDKVLADAVKAVKDAATAGSVINTKKALDAFGFEYEALVVADLTALKAVTSVQDIQAYFLVANFDALINDAVNLGATAADTVVDDLKLYEALEYGVEAGLLTDVNFDKYFTTYVATIKGFATADATKLTATGIQTNVIDTAVQATVTNAENAVKALTAASDETVITAAEALVAVVDETSVYEDSKANLTVAGVSVEVKGQNVKEALTAIVEDIKAAKIVYTVITASNPINQAKLNTALQEAGVDRAYEDYIVEYATELAGLTTTADSLTEIQGFIDGVNDTKATALVAAAVADLSPENVAAAEEAINRLAPDVEGSRTKVADLTAQLEAAATAAADLAAATAAVEALTNAAGDALAAGVGQAEIDAASELVEALPADVSPATDKADLQALVEAAQALQDAVNLVEATKAVEALTNAAGDALAEGVGQAEIDAASELVEALPADVSPATDKEDLQALVEAAQALQDVVNLATATAAVEALTNAAGDALAEGVGQAEIDAASELVEALPADVSPATDKEDLQAAVAAAQELLDTKAINDAIANKDVTALQEIIVGLGSTTFGNLSKAQRAELGEYIINKAHSEEPVTTYTATADFKSAIDTASTGFVATYVADIAAFNTATNATIASTGATKAQKDAVVAAIKKVTTLEGFTAVTELDLAEAILDAKPEAGYNVKTIAEIKALVEANK